MVSTTASPYSLKLFIFSACSILLVILVLSIAPALRAQAVDTVAPSMRPFSKLGVGVNIGTLGLGAEAATPLANTLNRGTANMPKPVGPLTLAIAQSTLNEQINQTTADNTLLTCVACYDPDDKADNDNAVVVSTYSPSMNQFLTKLGYIRVASNQQGYTEVFTAKAKRSKYYDFNDHSPGLRLANFRNPKILTSRITDLKHVPIEYDLVPTEITAGFFGKVQTVKSFVSFSLENDTWEICVACSR